MKLLALLILILAVIALFVLAACYISSRADQHLTDTEWRRNLHDDYFD